MRLLRSSFLSLLLAATVVAPVLPIEPVQAQGRYVEREVRRYTVRPGDTMSSIARAAGISIDALRRLNPDIDPRFLRAGQTVYLPARAAPIAELAIELDRYRGRPRENVFITASGFEPGASLRVLAGEGPYRLEPIERVRADRRGRVELPVALPEWARPGMRVYFALQSRNGRDRVVARPYEVVGRSRPDRNLIEMTGTITRQGVECPTMRGDDGRTYSLLGDIRGFRPGDRVSISGRVAEMSFCQQGTAVEVRRIAPSD